MHFERGLAAVLFAGGVGQLQTLIDGVSSQNESFPVGVNVTYVCNVETNVHTWSIPALSIERNIVSGTAPAIAPPFMIRPISLIGSRLTSSISFRTYVGLNGTAITCGDSANPNAERQEAIIIVEGEFVQSVLFIINCPPLLLSTWVHGRS